MRCPKCEASGSREVSIIDSRDIIQGDIMVRRRRYRCKCGERFSTLEVPAVSCGTNGMYPVLPSEMSADRRLDDKIDNVIEYLKGCKTRRVR
jgi:hypothetical protein